MDNNTQENHDSSLMKKSWTPHWIHRNNDKAFGWGPTYHRWSEKNHQSPIFTTFKKEQRTD